MLYGFPQLLTSYQRQTLSKGNFLEYFKKHEDLVGRLGEPLVFVAYSVWSGERCRRGWLMHRSICVLGAERQEEGVRVGGDLLFTGILAT